MQSAALLIWAAAIIGLWQGVVVVFGPGHKLPFLGIVLAVHLIAVGYGQRQEAAQTEP